MGIVIHLFLHAMDMDMDMNMQSTLASSLLYLIDSLDDLMI